MPKCVKCNLFFPPNYTDVIPNHMPDENGTYSQECIFCKLQVDEVERETSLDSGQYIKYTKKQCAEDYKKFLDKLKMSKNVQEINNTIKKF